MASADRAGLKSWAQTRSAVTAPGSGEGESAVTVADVVESDRRNDRGKDMLRSLGLEEGAEVDWPGRPKARRRPQNAFAAFWLHAPRTAFRQSEQECESGQSASSPSLRMRVCFWSASSPLNFPRSSGATPPRPSLWHVTAGRPRRGSMSGFEQGMSSTGALDR